MATTSKKQAGVSPRKKVVVLLKVTVSFGLLAWIVSQAQLGEILLALSHARPGYLALAALLPGVGYFITANRWGGLLKAQSVQTPVRVLFTSCVAAGFVRQFLPSTIGGDAIRGYDSWRAGASKSAALASLMVDRILGLLALSLFAVTSLAFAADIQQNYPGLQSWVWLGLAVLASTTCFVFLPTPRLVGLIQAILHRLPHKLGSPFEKLLTAVTEYQGKIGSLARALFLSILLQLNVVTFYAIIGKALGFPIPFQMYFLIVPLAIFVMLVPVSINAIGVREGIFTLLLGLFQISSAEAVAFAWIEHGIFLLWGVLGGIVYVARRDPQKSSGSCVMADQPV